MKRLLAVCLLAALVAPADAQLRRAPGPVRDLPRRLPSPTPEPTVIAGAPIPGPEACDPQQLAVITNLLLGMGPARITLPVCDEPTAICETQAKAIELEAKAAVERSRLQLQRTQRYLAQNCQG